MLAELDGGDWPHVFSEAMGYGYGYDDDTMEYKNNACEAVPPGAKVNTKGFHRSDVQEVIAMVDGENESEDWACLVLTQDGRYAYITAGCDYTGWDCQAGGSCLVANSFEDIMQYGVSEAERARLGLIADRGPCV